MESMAATMDMTHVVTLDLLHTIHTARNNFFFL
jgi:hypothetical protein